MTQAEEFYKAAGERLRTLKDEKPDGVTWESHVVEQCDISKRYADKVIAMFEGRTPLEAEREKNRGATAP